MIQHEEEYRGYSLKVFKDEKPLSWHHSEPFGVGIYVADEWRVRQYFQTTQDAMRHGRETIDFIEKALADEERAKNND